MVCNCTSNVCTFSLYYSKNFMHICCHLLKLWPITVEVQWESLYRKFFTLSDILSLKMMVKTDIKKISIHLA